MIITHNIQKIYYNSHAIVHMNQRNYHLQKLEDKSKVSLMANINLVLNLVK